MGLKQSKNRSAISTKQIRRTVMFEWNVEDMSLLNEKCKFYIGKNRIYACEDKVSREDKIEFLDRMNDGKMSYLVDLINKYNKEEESLPHDGYGYVKCVSLKAWIRRNDPKGLVDKNCHYGHFSFLGVERFIQLSYKQNYNQKGYHDAYGDLVDECFHRQLVRCEKMEKEYFETHDEYCSLKRQFKEFAQTYHTTFGVEAAFSSDGTVSIGDGEGKFRDITILELKELIGKYEQLEALINELARSTDIKYEKPLETPKGKKDEYER